MAHRAFVVAARNALPALLAERKADKERIAELETALKLALRYAKPGEYEFGCLRAELAGEKNRVQQLARENEQLKVLVEQALAGVKVQPSPDEEL